MLQVYLLTSISLFSLPCLMPGLFSGTYQVLTLPYVLPVAHIGMVRTSSVYPGKYSVYLHPQVGSIYTSLALSIERYAAVVHPFAKHK